MSPSVSGLYKWFQNRRVRLKLGTTYGLKPARFSDSTIQGSVSRVINLWSPRMSDRFSREDVERVARLARLELDAHEKELFARQLAGILEYAEQIQRVDTAGIEPTSHAPGSGASMREDVVQPSLPREASLAAAPDADLKAGLFKVPRVMG
jgi:aspartyl-tRNA(Asn)/glutamyl-tRNA(Gln) amidotransferase subunit C